MHLNRAAAHPPHASGTRAFLTVLVWGGQGDAMQARIRILAALAAGCAVGLAAMGHDRAQDAGWAVTASQVADARAHGKPGVEVAPGRFATEPVPSEGAARLPAKWVLLGLGAAGAVLAGTGRRKAAR